MECKECGSLMTDLTKGQGKRRHFYCHDCKAHCWDGKWFDLQAWEEWINE